MCLRIVHGFQFGDGIDILVGGDLGDLIHGIGITVTIIIISIFILDTIQEVHSIEISIGTTGIMETMVGGLDRWFTLIDINKDIIEPLIQDHNLFKKDIGFLEIGYL